ncbi:MULTISPECIES: DsbA family oxidoreductase [Lysinibacillus]|uniref:DsbA family oxidoreductase n=1 Tax=Lysinibacillus TaxID=400634 RepID=UPI001C8B180C|nr:MULTISPECIES: DsbA family oxidoreductase [Lysinibacillus]MBX8943052.1 DsbA family oxidoreductase [Lysinibacillus sp. K60]UUV26697.1 DsbA family oxidoreductase [Lysinibacillus sp. FN11]UYB49579.1 DsbA family oxidoreductase [Lysinibacillus capsici]WDU81561.1 DsbA family oxidoreductase [Lysinibacillus sp. G01H]
MKVEIWSDFVCPFCYMGKHNFEIGLEQFEHKEKVEVVFRSFQLDPYAKKNTGMDIHQVSSSKHGIPYEKAKERNNKLKQHAKKVGLDYQLDTMIPTNSYDALRLSYYAKENGKMEEYMDRIMKAHFTDSLDIGDPSTLAQLANELGLNANETLNVLANDKYSEKIAADKAEGIKIGVQGVPLFVVDNKYAISGAQSNQVFLETLQQVWKEDYANNKAEEQLEPSLDNYCSDGTCSK